MKNDFVCIACDSQAPPGIFCTAAERVVLECIHCRLCKTERTQSAQLPDDLYGEHYFDGSHGYGQDYSGDFIREYDRQRFNEELSDLERIAAKGNILDVGCATGNFLHAAQLRGWRVFGYDISEHAVRTVRTRIPGAVAESGKLGAATFNNEKFGVITLHHVLEHIEYPSVFLRETIFPLLKEDGLVLLEVPNIASLEALALRDQWEDLRPEQHLWHFTAKALGLLVTKAGGKVLHCYTRGVPLWRTRLLPDYLWMIAARFLDIPYRGKVGRGGIPVAATAPGSLPSGTAVPGTTGRLTAFCKSIGTPVMSYINARNMGKRLVLIARKEIV